MDKTSVTDILKYVFSSWQVIVVTLAILLYIHLVNHVAKRYHRPRSIKFDKIKIFKKKAKQPAAMGDGIEEAITSSDTNDELGLEEA